MIIFNYVNALERYIKYTDEDPSKTSGYDKKTRCIVKLLVENDAKCNVEVSEQSG